MYNEPEDTLEPGGHGQTWPVILGEAHKHGGQCVSPEGREQTLSMQRAWAVQVLLKDDGNLQQVLLWRTKMGHRRG